MRKCDSGKQEQFTYCKYGNYQFKRSSGFYTINIQRGENEVSKDCNGEDRHLRKKQIEVSTNSKSNGRRCKYEFNILCHSSHKSELSAKGTGCIIKCTACFGDGAC